MLYVMTERWPAGHTYRDVFERIKVTVTDAIIKGKHKTTRDSSGDDITERCKGLNEGFSGGAKNDITRMITDMTGQKVTIGTGVSPVQESDTIEVFDGTSVNFNDPNFINGLESFEALSNGWDLAMFNGASLDFGDGGVATEDSLQI